MTKKERLRIFNEIYQRVRKIFEDYPEMSYSLVIESPNPTEELGVSISGSLCPVCCAEKMITLNSTGGIDHYGDCETKEVPTLEILKYLEVTNSTKKH